MLQFFFFASVPILITVLAFDTHLFCCPGDPYFKTCPCTRYQVPFTTGVRVQCTRTLVLVPPVPCHLVRPRTTVQH